MLKFTFFILKFANLSFGHSVAIFSLLKAIAFLAQKQPSSLAVKTTGATVVFILALLTYGQSFNSRHYLKRKKGA